MPRRPPNPTEVQAVYRRRLQQIRMHRGWRQRELAEEMAKIGHPIGRPAIAKIESGTRKMQVEELVAFAVALGVSPAAIFLPRDDEFVDLTREVRVTAEEAERWASGEKPLRPSDDPLYYLESPTVFAEVRTQIQMRTRAAGTVTRGHEKEEQS